MFSKIIYIVSFIVFTYLVKENYDLLLKVPEYLFQANLLLILLAIILQILKYIVLSYNFYINFKQAGVNFTYWETFKATFVYIYVSVATPFVGAGGLLAFVDYAGHKEFSRIKAGAGAFLALLADYLSFFMIIIFSLIFFKDSSHDFPINFIYSMIGFGSLLITLVFLSIFKKDFLIKFILMIKKSLNFVSKRIHHKLVIDENWAHTNVTLAHECFIDIKHNPKFYYKPIFIALLFHVLNIASLAVVAWSFKEVIPVSKVVSSYVVLNTLETISPTPNGIGVIEVAVPYFLETIGIERDISITIVTMFRLIYFYLPLLLGFYFSYKLFIRKEKRT